MPTKVLVSDTNIWIDLHRCGLLEVAFSLPYEYVATDFVFRELKKPDGVDLQKMGLQVVALPKESMTSLSQLTRALNNSSLADVSCYHVAAENGWTLLTGDRQIRRACLDRDMDVHGVLWVLDQLWFHKVVPGPDLAYSLAHMLDCGARLPQAECDKRIKRWSA